MKEDPFITLKLPPADAKLIAEAVTSYALNNFGSTEEIRLRLEFWVQVLEQEISRKADAS